MPFGGHLKSLSDGQVNRKDPVAAQVVALLPMIMRGRIELRLDSALNPGDSADEMTAKALKDTTRADNIGREGYEKALRDYQTRRAQE